jgi:hypothetical protein
MGIAIIIGTLVVLAIAIAVVYSVLIGRTRRERTSHGAHRAGPGRSSPRPR